MRGHRIEGADKVSGRAPFVDDLREDVLGFTPLIALAVTAPVGSGVVRRIETDPALALPGVRAVMTHQNAPPLRKVISLSMSEPGVLLPLQSPRIAYAGQVVAVVVAESLQAARRGVAAVTFDIAGGPAPVVTLEDADGRLRPVRRAGIGPGRSRKGGADAALAAAAVATDDTFLNAPHHQNPLEPGAVIARWDDDGGVTVHAAVQWHHIDAMMIGQAFGLGWADGMPGFLRRVIGTSRHDGRVRLFNHFSGGAFGRNISYQALLLAPMAARVVEAPVKFVQTRRDTFSLMSHRAEVRQRLRMGAHPDGRLAGIVLEPDIAKGNAAFVEPVGEMPFQLYAHDTHRLTSRVAQLDLPGAGWMRGPGVAHAIFALEQGMDRLAARLGMDPLDIRLVNHADIHPVSGKPWETKALREAYAAGAAAIGWRERPKGGTVRTDGRLTGYGMASAIDLGRQFPATAHVTLTADACAVVSVAIAEMGQGLLTGLTGLVSEMTGLPPERITLRRSATSEGYAAGSIGSTGTYSNAAAIQDALHRIAVRLAQRARRDRSSPLSGRSAKGAQIEGRDLVLADGARVPLADLLRRHGEQSASGRAGLTFGASRKAKASFGAVFCEMAVDPITLEIEVLRLVGAYDCGRVLQPAIAAAQLRGAMIMGLGQALMEETRLDRRTGAWTNAELGEALIPTQADVPHVEVLTVGSGAGDGPLDFKGIAETAIVGVAPAIASAFADATGGLIRSLPMTNAERLRAVSAIGTPAPVESME
jgi:xanthine dehydrogenase YagR molybdenum-binding subunit